MTHIGNLIAPLALSTMLAVASAPASAAEPVSPFYLSAAGGVIFSPLLKSSDGTNQKFSTYPGGIASLAIGAYAGNGFRVELEGLYIAQTLSSIKTLRVNGAYMPLSNFHGGQRVTTAALTNAIYDLPFDLPVKPFVGAGVGIGWLSYGGVSGMESTTISGLPNGNIYSGPVTLSYEGTTSLAYQFMAGVSWKVPGVAGLELTLQNKLFGLAAASSRNLARGPDTLLFNGKVATGSRATTVSPVSDAVMLGLRYTFNAPQ